MKPLRIFLLISCFVITLYFLIFSFSDISLQHKHVKKNALVLATKNSKSVLILMQIREYVP